MEHGAAFLTKKSTLLSLQLFEWEGGQENEDEDEDEDEDLHMKDNIVSFQPIVQSWAEQKVQSAVHALAAARRHQHAICIDKNPSEQQRISRF